MEPFVTDVQKLNLSDEGHRVLFLELEDALKLHTRLIRDVRIFHDEVRFQKVQPEDKQYRLYDLKLKLGPFARESAIADALQQAMSALSVGIYQQEASEVIARLCEVYTKPVRKRYEQMQDPDENSQTTQYNYDIYLVYGRKMAAYSDRLSAQSSIRLMSLAFGELDYLNRQLSQSLHDLHSIGQHLSDPPPHRDVEELERQIHQIRSPE